MSTFVFKRLYSTAPGSNQINGENAGDSIGSAVGGAAGTAAGATLGTAAGALTGVGVGAYKGKQAYNAAKSAGATTGKALGAGLKKAGKVGGLLTVGGMLAGAIAGGASGKQIGRDTGVAVGGGVGAGVDAVTGQNQRSYSVSRVTKSVYGVAKKVTPKSKRMKLARKAVETDKKVKGAAFEIAANPGGVVQKGVEYGSKHPSTGILWAAGNTAAPALPGITAGSMAIGSKIDKVGRRYAPKLYEGIEKVGYKLAPVANGLTNSAYNLARSFSKDNLK